MKKILLMMLVMFVFPVICSANAQVSTPVKNNNIQIEKYSIAGIEDIDSYNGPVKLAPPEIGSIAGIKDHSLMPLQRGCCSWHRGVCACDEEKGRIICCDNTYSPSCRC